MQFSHKIVESRLSPMRKFHTRAVAAAQRGVKLYHLNIGQPDIVTPPAFFDAVKRFSAPTLAYAPSAGVPELIAAIQRYYDNLGIHYGSDEIYITAGGSEALLMVFAAILDDGEGLVGHCGSVPACCAGIRLGVRPAPRQEERPSGG